MIVVVATLGSVVTLRKTKINRLAFVLFRLASRLNSTDWSLRSSNIAQFLVALSLAVGNAVEIAERFVSGARSAGADVAGLRIANVGGVGGVGKSAESSDESDGEEFRVVHVL